MECKTLEDMIQHEKDFWHEMKTLELEIEQNRKLIKF